MLKAWYYYRTQLAGLIFFYLLITIRLMLNADFIKKLNVRISE